MMSKKITALLVPAIIVLFSSCAPNNEMYLSKAAGLWAGLWHGLICIVTFIISLFTDGVGVYETNNSGSWYDFGFVLGIMISLGHGGLWRPVKKNIPCKSDSEKDWEKIGIKVEEKIKRELRNWAEK